MKLNNKRYEEIKKEVSVLLEEYNVKKLPIDVFQLAEDMNIKIKYASQMLLKNPDLSEYYFFTLPDSYLYYNIDTQKFYVYLNDISNSEKRQRFSLAHEIMHIRLAHTSQNLKNEAEANFGATYLLAPTSLVLITDTYECLTDDEFLKNTFNISKPLADIAKRYYENRVSCCCKTAAAYEITINDQLLDSLEKSMRKNKINDV